MTTPYQPSVACHIPVRGPLVFPRVPEDAAPTARNPAFAGTPVQRHVLGRAERAVCKTVGSAYDGSNPSPATTSGNGSLAANSRARRVVLLVPACVILYRRRPSCCAVHGRMADGVRAGRSVCTVGFPRTATDGPRRRRVLARCAGRAGACIRIRSLAASETVTLAGRPERRGSPERSEGCQVWPLVRGCRGLADASCSVTVPGTAGRTQEGETVIVAVDNGLDKRADRRLGVAVDGGGGPLLATCRISSYASTC